MHKIKMYSAKNTVRVNKGILFYMSIRIRSDCFTWQQAALFQLAVSRGSRV
jgi:hypothetical protein